MHFAVRFIDLYLKLIMFHVFFNWKEIFWSIEEEENFLQFEAIYLKKGFMSKNLKMALSIGRNIIL